MAESLLKAVVLLGLAAFALPTRADTARQQNMKACDAEAKTKVRRGRHAQDVHERVPGQLATRALLRRGLVVGLLSLAVTAHAQFLTGAQLLQHLDEADAGSSFAKRTLSMGYVSAVYDLAQEDRVCPREPVAASELMKVVRLFLRAHPERQHEPGAKLVLDALTSRFPCGR